MKRLKIATTMALGVLLSGHANAEVAGDVTIGVLAPVSGRMSSFGAQWTGALKLFEETSAKLNDKAKMKFVVYDTRGDITETISLTRRLAGDKNVIAIVGPFFSGEVEVAFPIAVQAKIPIVAPVATKPGMASKNTPYGFQYALTSDQKTTALVDKWLASNEKPIKRVVIVMDSKEAISRSEGTVDFPEALKKRGVEIADTISIQSGDLDFSAPITRAKSHNPDGLILATLHSEGANLMREMRKQGMHQPVLAGVGIVNPHFITAGGPAVEGVMVGTDFAADIGRPMVTSFVSDFEKRNSLAATSVAANMFDSLSIMRHCILSSGITGTVSDVNGNREKIKKCWSELKDYGAPLAGTVSMNARGESVRDVVILRVKDGRFTAVANQ